MILFCFLLPSVERSTAPKSQGSRKIGGKDWAGPPIDEMDESDAEDGSGSVSSASSAEESISSYSSDGEE